MLAIIFMIGAGILFTISLSNPSLYFLNWLSFIVVLSVLQKSNLKESFYRGWILGIVIITGSAYGLYFPLRDFSGLPVIFMLFILIVLFILLGLFYAFWALIYKYINGNNEVHPLLFASSWAALEFTRFKILPVFPFSFTAYTQTGFRSFLQMADLGGMFIISFLLAFIAAYLYKAGKNKKIKYIVPVIIILIIILSYGNYQYKFYENKNYETKSVGIVNTVIEQENKWKSAWIEKNTNEIISSASNFVDVDLIVTPETSLTFDIIRNEYYRKKFLDKVKEKNTYFQIGAQSIQNNTDRKYNSVFLISPDGEIIDRYNKRFLVPFGEYIPFQDKFAIIDNLNLHSLDQGVEERVFTIPSASWVTSICSEIFYPLLYSSGFDFLINHSNEAWFKESNIKVQMWSAALLRAVEYRTSVIKSGNYSWSGIILPSGKTSILYKNGEDAQGLIKINRESTLFQQWGKYFGWGALFIVILAAFIRLLIQKNN